MITKLLQTGRNKLIAQAASPTTRLRVTGFKVGDTYGIEFDTNVTAAIGNLVYTGAANKITYIPYYNNSIMLRLLITADVPEIQIGNILLEVDSTPFCLSMTSHQLIKLSTITSEVGIRFVFQLNFNISDFYSVFILDNIIQDLATFIPAADEAALLALANPMSSYDQAILNTHTATGRPTPVLYIDGEYWGNPLFTPIEDDFLIDGGAAGDGYLYT